MYGVLCKLIFSLLFVLYALGIGATKAFAQEDQTPCPATLSSAAMEGDFEMVEFLIENYVDLKPCHLLLDRLRDRISSLIALQQSHNAQRKNLYLYYWGGGRTAVYSQEINNLEATSRLLSKHLPPDNDLTDPELDEESHWLHRFHRWLIDYSHSIKICKDDWSKERCSQAIEFELNSYKSPY